MASTTVFWGAGQGETRIVVAVFVSLFFCASLQVPEEYSPPGLFKIGVFLKRLDCLIEENVKLMGQGDKKNINFLF